MVGHGGSSAGSYLADPTFPIPSHCAVIILFEKCPSASIVATSTLRVKSRAVMEIVIDVEPNINVMNQRSVIVRRARDDERRALLLL